MKRRVYAIRLIDRQIEVTKGKILLFGIGIDEPTVQWMESFDSDYCGLIMDMPTKKMDFNPDTTS